MSPQPVRRLKIEGSGLGQSMDSVEKAPAGPCEMMARVIGAYSMIDLYYTQFVAACIGQDYLKVAAMLREIDKYRSARERIVETWITMRFTNTPTDLMVINVVRTQYMSAKKIRDALAHGVWGEVHGRPDLLVMIPPDSMVADFAGVASILDAEEGSELEANIMAAFEAPYNTAVYYTRDELMSHFQVFLETAYNIQLATQFALDSRVSVPARVELYRRLSVPLPPDPPSSSPESQTPPPSEDRTSSQ